MSFKTPILCDRRIYDKKGKWKSPNNDVAENIFYFIKEALSMTTDYVNGKEQVVEEVTITVFGGKPIVKGDTITLCDGTEYEVTDIVVHYIESNILVKDMLKQRIESMELTLR